MKSTLALMLTIAATCPLTVASCAEPKPTGRNAKSKEEQEKAIIAAQIKRDKRAAKRLGKS